MFYSRVKYFSTILVSKPIFYQFYDKREARYKVGEDILFHYNVSSIPEPNITWFIVRDGKPDEVMAICSGVGKCQKKASFPSIFVSRNRFSVKDIRYRQHNASFKCLAVNVFGNTSKSFSLFVLSKYYVVN